MENREKFSSRIGFLLISAGCAIGLGNVWRFPFITGQYGGAAFVLIYLFFLIILGLPILVMEYAVGRASQKSIARSFQVLEPKGTKWHWYSYVGMAGNYLLMMFYTTVAGWMISYFFKMLKGDFVGKNPAQVENTFGTMLSDPKAQIFWMLVVIALGFLVCSLGLQNGVEKITTVMMSCLFIVILVLIVRSVTLDGASAGLKFYLIPDFAAVKKQGVMTVVSAAMGQAFFTQPSTNFIMLWAVFNGIVGLILFAIYLKQDVTPEERHAIYTQLKIGRTDFFLTLLLAITVFVLFYSFVFAGEYFFQTDFRFWVLGICTFTSDKLLVLLQYLPFYFIYYLSISMTENYVLCADPAKETRNVILSGLANMLGIFVINAAQYIKLFTTKTALWTDDRLYPMVVLPLIVLLFPAAVINRHLYKATGKIWLGAMINTLIIVMIGVANTATLSFL